MKYKMIYHLHTRYSKDSLQPLCVLRFMCKLKGINCVVITDHDNIQGAKIFKSKYENQKFKVVIGEEITTSCGEVVGLFLKEAVQPGLSPEDTMKQIIQQGGLVSVPHPFDSKRSKSVLPIDCIMKLLPYIHFVEYYNARTVKYEDRTRQKQIAAQCNKPFLLAEDSHVFFEVGRNVMLVNKINITKGNLSNIIMSDTTEYQTSLPLKTAHVCTKFDRAVKLLLQGDIGGIYRAVVRDVKKGK